MRGRMDGRAYAGLSASAFELTINQGCLVPFAWQGWSDLWMCRILNFCAHAGAIFECCLQPGNNFQGCPFPGDRLPPPPRGRFLGNGNLCLLFKKFEDFCTSRGNWPIFFYFSLLSNSPVRGNIPTGYEYDPQ